MENSGDILSLLLNTTTTGGEKANRLSKDDIELEISKVNLEHQRETLEGKKQDRKQRGVFSVCIFGFVCLYIVAVLAIVVLCGADVLSLDTTLLVTLLSSTTANVIGIFIIVAKYLFHSNE